MNGDDPDKSIQTWNFMLAEFVRGMHARLEYEPLEAALEAERNGLFLRFEEINALRDRCLAILVETRLSRTFAGRIRELSGEPDDFSTTHGKASQLDGSESRLVDRHDVRFVPFAEEARE